MFRTVRIAWVVVPFVLSFRRDRRRWLFWGSPLPRSEAFHLQRAERVVMAIARLGPTFVKLAQIFAGRSDIMPEAYAHALGRLTDQVPAVAWPAIAQQIRDAYGSEPETVFATIDQVPIASASLGQVHRATWQGRDVAVKVLRPGVEEVVAMDIAAASRILVFVVKRWPHPQLRAFQRILDEFGRKVGEEMDFRHEAANADRIRLNFLQQQRDVIIPEVIHELTRHQVLVLEFCEGRRVDDIEAWIREGRVRPDQLVDRVIELFTRMMLIDGFFHADPHPGNLFLSPDGRIILLDFGMVVEVPVELRRQLGRAVFAAIRRDTDQMTDSFFELGLVEPGTDRPTIHALVQTLFALAEQRTTNRERLQQLTEQILSALYDWPIILPSHLVYFARTAALIEGLGVRYDPMFNPLLNAAPVALRLYPEVMASLREGGDGRRPGRAGWAEVLGGLAGEMAGVVARAGGELASIATRRIRPVLATSALGQAATELVGDLVEEGSRWLRPRSNGPGRRPPWPSLPPGPAEEP